MTNYLCKLTWILPFFILLNGCQENKESKTPLNRYVIEGETMGTYYRIIYLDSIEHDFKKEIDSILISINDEVSTYLEQATISRFNHSDSGIIIEPNELHFIRNLEASREIYTISGGMFDPTVMPLVNYWGFGYTPKKPVDHIDSAKIITLLKWVGLPAVQGVDIEKSGFLSKPFKEVELDFSAIAKGYAVDILGKWLEDKGLNHILVDIGGELRAWGNNELELPWQIGISIPDSMRGPEEIHSKIALTNRAMATSGNYRQFHEVDGMKYSHTIHPKTGFPELSNLLSATILASDCMTADALATTCMVMGLESGIPFIQSLSDVEALLIFSDPKGELQTWYSTGMDSLILK